MRSPVRQRGLAMLVLVALFAVAAAYMLVSSLNQSSNAVALARAAKNRDALMQAKAALLAWSSSESLQGGTFKPGALPCPDRNNDGNAESSCSSSTRVGRLPYKTLGIAPIYDASGELLWYGISNSFKRSTSNPINSDTQGTLTVTGLAPASNVVAVVLAPGARLSTQDRSFSGTICSSTSDPCNTTSNYLEGLNSDTSSYNDYESRMENTTDSVAANLFNDQLLAITQADLMSVVEPAVAAYIAQDVVGQYVYNSDPTLTDSSKQWSDNSANRNKSRYFDAWGGFPYAATFTDPSSSSFSGTVGKYEGLLPVIDSLSFVGSDYYSWTVGSGSIIKTGGSGTITSTDCSATTSSNLKCTVSWSGFLVQPTIRMSGTVARVGRAFVRLPQLSDVTTSGGSIGSRTLSGSLSSNGAGTVMLDATLPCCFGGTLTITIKNTNLIDNPLISTADPIAGWFTSNEWHMLTYYAVSTGYAPGGAGACAAGGTCLTVNNLSTTPNNNKYAILILGGRSLNGNSRPSSTLGDYLEAQNASTGDRIFEQGLRNVSSAGTEINDRVVVIAP